MLRKSLQVIQDKAPAEKEWWEKRRAAVSEGFMKELDEEKTGAGKAGSEEDGVLVDSNTPAGTPSGSKKKKGKK